MSGANFLYHLDYESVFSSKTHHLLQNKQNVDLYLNEDIIRSTRPEMRLYELRQTEMLPNDPNKREPMLSRFSLSVTGRIP